MIRKMTQADYEEVFNLWKSTDGIGTITRHCPEIPGNSSKERNLWK